MPPKNFDDEGDGQELTRDHIFTGADHDEDNEKIEGDRGDDPDFIEPDEDDEDGDADDSEGDSEGDESEGDADKADEGDSDDDETPDGDDSDDADSDDEEGEDDKVSPYVSKDRFNVVNERMKLAEKALQNREAEQLAIEDAKEVEKFDFDAKELAYMELVNDGEYDKANAVRKEIRAAERAEIQAEQNAQTQDSTAKVSSQIAFSNKITELNEEFDEFNPEHENYDQSLVDEAVERRDMFMNRGMDMAAALDKAAREVAKLYDVESKFERMADEEIARQEAEKKPAKKKTDVKKKVAQAKKQPTKMDEGSANDDGEKTALNMDEAEFDSLPESTKARMRGDIL